MHHYRSDETDVFFTSSVPTVSKSDRPHIVIDSTTGISWVNLGGTPAGVAYTYLRLGGPASASYETVTGASRVLTAADDGMIFFLARAGGIDFTLPANATPGFRCTFIVKTAPTTICNVTAATADTIIGWPINVGGADSAADGNAAGDVLSFAANTALPGDRADFVCDGTSWHVRATAKVINAIVITG